MTDHLTLLPPEEKKLNKRRIILKFIITFYPLLDYFFNCSLYFDKQVKILPARKPPSSKRLSLLTFGLLLAKARWRAVE